MTRIDQNRRMGISQHSLRWTLRLGLLMCFLLLHNLSNLQLQLRFNNSGSDTGESFTLKRSPYPSSLSNKSTIKMKNISHSNNPLDYSVVIVHYHKTGNQISNELLNTLLKGGDSLGLQDLERRHRHGPTGLTDRDKARDRYDQMRKESGRERVPRRSNGDDDDDNPRRHGRYRNHADSDSDRHLPRRYTMPLQRNSDENVYLERREHSRTCSEQKVRYGRRRKRQPKRYHDQKTKCPILSLELGTASIVTAPNFFCSIDVLDEILTPSQSYHRPSRYHEKGVRPKTKFFGTKIIHLIRDPFDMALSNYFYHSQVPTPELWVTEDCNPCDTTYHDLYSNPTNETVLDLILPTLKNISQSQIDDVVSLCRSIFHNPDNGPELLDAPLYNHLTNLEQYDALRLSASRQIIGGGGRSGHAGQDILRMTNNVVKLHQLIDRSVEIISPTSSLDGRKQNDIQLLTMKLAQWNLDPYGSMMTALDFVFGESISQERKVYLATEYKDVYEMKASDTDRKHFTSNKDVVREQKQKLLELLKEDHVLGPVLGEIQDELRLYA